jgi:hypothetical protein
MKCSSSKGLIKRALPFFATLAVALFITSFFVDISRPRFGRGHGGKQEMYRLRMENEQLRAENERLRAENEMRAAPLANRHPEYLDLDLEVPAPPLTPAAPVAPHAHK